MLKRLAALALALASVAPALVAPAAAQEIVQTQQYSQGQQVQASDLSGDQEAYRNLVGGLAYAILGQSDVLPMTNPVSIVTSSISLSLTVGGPTETLLVYDPVSQRTRMVDNCGAQTFTIPNNTSGGTRNDLVSIKYQQTQTNPHSVLFSNGNTQTVYDINESCAYHYATNTSSPPAGYQAFAKVAVPNGATTGSQATVTYLFDTVQQIFQIGSGGVISLNSMTGALNIIGGTGITITPSGGGNITVSTSALLSAVTTLNSLSSAVTIAGSGCVGVTTSGQTITISCTASAGATTTTAPISMPANGTTGVSVPVNNGGAFPNHAYFIVSSGSDAFIAHVTSGGGTDSLTATSDQIVSGTAGDSISSGAAVSFSGPPANSQPGYSAFNGQTFSEMSQIEGGNSITADPGTLPGGSGANYACEGHANGFGLGSDNTTTASLSGGGSGSWVGSPATIGGGASTRYLMIYGTATGGQDPTVSLTSAGGWPDMLEGGGTGYVTILCVRTS